MSLKIVFTDYDFEDIDTEKKVFEDFDCQILELQSKDENTLIGVCSDADALIVQYAPITSRVIESMQRCKIISRYGIGVDMIDIKAATSKGILVCNAPDYCIDEVADHTLALILSLSRKIIALVSSVKDRRWDAIGVAKPIYNLKKLTLGLIGFGKIPQNLYPKVKALFGKIIVYDPYLKEDIIKKYNLTQSSFLNLIRTSDIISLHCPLTEDTFHLISEKQFQLMKPNAYIVNTSRGSLIDTTSLYQALKAGHIAGASLDVLEEEPPGIEYELVNFDNVIITPHAAFYSESALEDLKYKVALNVAKALKGEEQVNVINWEVIE